MKNLVKKILLSLFAVGTLSFASAQKVDAKAKSILDAVSANYKNKSNMYFKFLYGTGSNGKVNKSQTGIFYSAKDKYKLKIYGNEQIYDGNKVYNINAEDQEVTIAKPNGINNIFSPTRYVEAYKKGYNVSYMGKRNINGVSADLIKLVPIKDDGVKEVYLFINSANKQMVKLEQYADNNDVAVISIKQYKENQRLSPSVFKYNAAQYKNYITTEL